jgi:hypothetical protein
LLSFDELLRRLGEAPRENGSAALAETATFLADALRAAGAEVRSIPFLAQPYANRLAGLAAIVCGIVCFRWLRSGRYLSTAILFVVQSTLLFLQFRAANPILGLIAPAEQVNVEAALPTAEPTRRLILSCHYDTTTELFDHVQNARLDFVHLLVPGLVIGIAIFAATNRDKSERRWFRALVTLAGLAAVLEGVVVFLQVGAGALVPRKSHGAVDDGAACAVLVRLASRLEQSAPLANTDLRLLFFSSEEINLLGSSAYAGTTLPRLDPLPTSVVNLEGLGESENLAVLGSEPRGFAMLGPGDDLLAILDRVYRSKYGTPILVGPYPAQTDAQSFLARGVPALTLASYVPGRLTRGLHSARDTRARVDEEALAETQDYLEAFVREFDRGGEDGGSPR